MTQIRCAFPTHSNHQLSRPSRYASLANELEGYKYTIKYDDGDQRSSVRKAVGSTSRPFSSSRLTFRMMGISVIFTIVTVNGTNHQRNHPITIVGHLMMTATEGIERLKFLVAIITRSFFTLFFKGEVWNFFDWIERGETRETSNDRQLIRRILLYDWLALLHVAMASKGAYYIN